MPHRRSPEKLKQQQERYKKYFQNIPRFEVASTFTVKQNHTVSVTSDNALVMKHQRNAVGVCLSCGSTENLHVHHIDKNHSNNLPENLLVLCVKCHRKEHTELNKKCLIVIKEAQKNVRNEKKNGSVLSNAKKKLIQSEV